MQYILSILIPTKNRKEYLKQCVLEVLGACSDQVQVIIQDNSDEIWCEDDIKTYQRQNLEYYHEFGEISFVENFSKALEKARGEYICFIGDDDGVMPEIETVAKYMWDNNIDAVSQNISATYFWPTEKNDMGKGLLRLFYANNSVHIKKTKKELIKLFKAGGQGYLERGIVKAYHGIVRKCFFDRIKQSTGKYVNGLSPDIYLAVALSNFVNEVYIINFPITISGISPKSGGAASVNGLHTGNLIDAPHLRGHRNYTWDKLVPKIYSVETIWADSALNAARNLGINKIDKIFGRDYLLHICKKKYPQFKVEYRDYEGTYPVHFIRYSYEWLLNDMYPLVARIIRRLTRKKEDYVSYDNIKNINCAKNKIRGYIEMNRRTVDKTILNMELLKK